MSTRDGSAGMSSNLLDVMEKVLTAAGKDAATIMNQARSALVTSYSPTMVDVTVDSACPEASLPDAQLQGDRSSWTVWINRLARSSSGYELDG